MKEMLYCDKSQKMAESRMPRKWGKNETLKDKYELVPVVNLFILEQKKKMVRTWFCLKIN